MKNSSHLRKLFAFLAYATLPLAATVPASANAQQVLHTDLINHVPAAKSLSVRGPNFSGCYTLQLGRSVLGPDIFTNTSGMYTIIAMRAPGCAGGSGMAGLYRDFAISGNNGGRLTIEITNQGIAIH
ncbi:hypothetical protein Acav_1915 [Paracidovorax avenae ATCC 19860]|uniref:Uncharacterized protein n=1 Tax=Paracidovorax avenae (strain ATCC 19860 / DSM 7227 / CCUG 15838 / JCM 20985 / LMG 2117 / NCPPB 1011) TaxID=643561 RepID=F0Q831_PARA1|nr:hypothetical protein [Paracidovorax avenae]ADX45829.1 hypothetical protein Acav_1915 [Paracidovorax avenae ATCC 19860]